MSEEPEPWSSVWQCMHYAQVEIEAWEFFRVVDPKRPQQRFRISAMTMWNQVGFIMLDGASR
jgi:hypothetical protein